MNRQRLFLGALVILVVFGAVAFIPAFIASVDQIAVASGISSPKVDHLAGAVWQVQGVSVGGGYQLWSVPLSPSGTGTQCCCTYLPCLLKKP